MLYINNVYNVEYRNTFLNLHKYKCQYKSHTHTPFFFYWFYFCVES